MAALSFTVFLLCCWAGCAGLFALIQHAGLHRHEADGPASKRRRNDRTNRLKYGWQLARAGPDEDEPMDSDDDVADEGCIISCTDGAHR